MGKKVLQNKVCGVHLCSGPLKVFNGVSLPVLHIEKGIFVHPHFQNRLHSDWTDRVPG